MIGSLIRQREIATDEQHALFEDLLRSTSRQAYGLAYRLTGSAPEAEDLVQETYLRAYKFFHRYDDSLPFLNWICRIMSNAHIDTVRRKSKLRLTSIDQPTASGFLAIEVPDANSSPDRVMLERAMNEPVQECLNQMTSAFRPAVLLADVEGMAYEEIAELMNTSVGTVRSRIHRGRRQLRSLLTKRCPNMVAEVSNEL